jgi:hypothetical protein
MRENEADSLGIRKSSINSQDGLLISPSPLLPSSWSQDTVSILGHVSFCITLSCLLILWEGLDCTYLKPLPATIRNYPTSSNYYKEQSDHDASNDDRRSFFGSSDSIENIIQLMNTSTRGMGRGAMDRMDGWYQATYWTTTTTTTTTAFDNNRRIEESNATPLPDSFSMRDIPSYN